MSVQSPSILIVEDEAILRLQAVLIFEDAGFTVFEADNADTALRMLEAHRDVQVVFTDVQMPGPFDGLDLAREVHQRFPAIGYRLDIGPPAS